MIHISSKIHGIEVLGMRHPIQTVHYHEDQIEPEQLEAFLASEYLTVEVDEPVEGVIDVSGGDSASAVLTQSNAESTDDAAADGVGEDNIVVDKESGFGKNAAVKKSTNAKK